MALGRYYNKMDYPIKMRKIWELGAPAIELQPGATLEGPIDMLSTYSFLAPLPFDFHNVDAMTMDDQKNFIDMKINERPDRPNFPTFSKPIEAPPNYSEREYPMNDVENLPSPTPLPASVEELIVPIHANSDIKNKLPFSVEGGVKWLEVKMEELEEACKILGIDISFTGNMNKKDKKWALVKAVKKAIGLDIK